MAKLKRISTRALKYVVTALFITALAAYIVSSVTISRLSAEVAGNAEARAARLSASVTEALEQSLGGCAAFADKLAAELGASVYGSGEELATSLIERSFREGSAADIVIAHSGGKLQSCSGRSYSLIRSYDTGRAAKLESGGVLYYCLYSPLPKGVPGLYPGAVSVGTVVSEETLREYLYIDHLDNGVSSCIFNLSDGAVICSSEPLPQDGESVTSFMFRILPLTSGDTAALSRIIREGSGHAALNEGSYLSFITSLKAEGLGVLINIPESLVNPGYYSVYTTLNRVLSFMVVLFAFICAALIYLSIKNTATQRRLNESLEAQTGLNADLRAVSRQFSAIIRCEMGDEPCYVVMTASPRHPQYRDYEYEAEGNVCFRRESYAENEVLEADREAFLNITSFENIRGIQRICREVSQELDYRTRDGEGYQWKRLILIVLPSNEGRSAGAYISIRNIDEIKRSELAAAQSRERFALTVRNAYLMILEADIDAASVTEYLSVKGELVINTREADWTEYIGERVETLIHPKHREGAYKLTSIKRLHKAEDEGVELRYNYLRSIEGLEGWHWCQVTIFVYRNDGRLCVRLFVQNIDNMVRQRELSELYRRLATVDELTGLNNRTALSEFVKTKTSKADFKSMAAVSIDLDNLKLANDQYGHKTGDIFIKTVAKLLQEAVGADGECFRTGGDEFVCLFFDSSKLRVQSTVDRLSADVLKHPALRSFEGHITCGVAYSEAPLDIDELIYEADKNMYENKDKMNYVRRILGDSRSADTVSFIFAGLAHPYITAYILDAKTGVCNFIQKPSDFPSGFSDASSLDEINSSFCQNFTNEENACVYREHMVIEKILAGTEGGAAYSFTAQRIIASEYRWVEWIITRIKATDKFLVVEHDINDRRLLAGKLSKIEHDNETLLWLSRYIEAAYIVNLTTSAMERIRNVGFPVDGEDYGEFMRGLSRYFGDSPDLAQLDTIEKLREELENRAGIGLPLLEAYDGRVYRMSVVKNFDYSEENPGVAISFRNVTGLAKNDELVSAAVQNSQAMERSRDQLIKLLGVLASVIEFRIPDNEFHIQNIQRYTLLLANELRRTHREYGLTETKCSLIAAVSAIHDIGKIFIPDSILLRRGEPDAAEAEIIRSHPAAGSEIIKKALPSGEWYSRICYDIVRCHHERYDGTGYPDGLAGDAIPIWAQIVALADAYDHLTRRYYSRDIYESGEAVRLICEGGYGSFNPALLDCLRNVEPRLAEIVRTNRENALQ